MTISIEQTPRTYYLKGVFFFLVFLLTTFFNFVSHSWTTGRIVFVVLGFGLVCLELVWGFRLSKSTKLR
jgi:hypothetical protein